MCAPHKSIGLRLNKAGKDGLIIVLESQASALQCQEPEVMDQGPAAAAPPSEGIPSNLILCCAPVGVLIMSYEYHVQYPCSLCFAI